ncbi:MAG: DUF368 domain-containing protein [Bacilli bacterium]|nr:DUF368 domain-containing protein [Bacilli bacterium]
MKNIILFIKGFIMGIANIIPGVSGGTLAIILGIYEEFIGALSHLLKNFKKNLLFIVPLGLGMLASIATMSNVIDYSFNHYPVATCLFFVGLVIGGIPLLTKKVKGKKDSKPIYNYSIFACTFALVICMACLEFFSKSGFSVSFNHISLLGLILLFLVGILAAGTMVIPGVSGSLVLMLIGYYRPVIKTIKSLVHFENVAHNLLLVGVFGLGILFGIIAISRLFEYLFKKHETKTYYGVLGFIYASVFAIPISLFATEVVTFKVLEVLVGIVLLVFGILVSYKLGEK